MLGVGFNMQLMPTLQHHGCSVSTTIDDLFEILHPQEFHLVFVVMLCGVRMWKRGVVAKPLQFSLLLHFVEGRHEPTLPSFEKQGGTTLQFCASVEFAGASPEEKWNVGVISKFLMQRLVSKDTCAELRVELKRYGGDYTFAIDQHGLFRTWCVMSISRRHWKSIDL